MAQGYRTYNGGLGNNDEGSPCQIAFCRRICVLTRWCVYGERAGKDYRNITVRGRDSPEVNGLEYLYEEIAEDERLNQFY